MQSEQLVCRWVRCRPEIETPPWPMFRCSRCGVFVEVRVRDIGAALSSLPECGVVARSILEQQALSTELHKRHLASVLKEHNLISRAIRYSAAVMRWIASGMPTRSETDVWRIYDTICAKCEHFGEKNRSCKICGCRVGRSGLALRNKIAMSTERCPDGRW